MDPITALILASLVTWGTVGSGIKDTAAIMKGQPPPSHAVRMARFQERAARREAKGRQRVVKPVRHRRIVLSDLLVHWWEDGLENADHWRENRHLSRPERLARRKKFLDNRKAQAKRGYALIKNRGQRRWHPEDPPEAPEEIEDAQKEAPEVGQPEPVRADNVIPLHPKNTHTNKKEIPMELLLGDKATYTAHDQALTKYEIYFTEIIDRLEQIGNRAKERKMSEAAAQLGVSVGEQVRTVGAKTTAARTQLQAAHQTVAEIRKHHGDTQVDADQVQD